MSLTALGDRNPGKRFFDVLAASGPRGLAADRADDSLAHVRFSFF